MKKNIRNKLLTIRLSDTEIKIIKDKKIENMSEIVRMILKNYPTLKNEKITIHKDGYELKNYNKINP